MSSFEDLLFPYEKAREIQEEFLLKVHETVCAKKNLIVHAPTGLGKTAAVLAPCLKYALENDKTVFFLTSRHTQHKIAIDTLSEIKKKYNKDFVAVSIIGKKELCLQDASETLYSHDFNEYCKYLKENELCEYFENINKKGELSAAANASLFSLQSREQVSTDDVIAEAQKHSLCPYEISLLLAKNAKVIVGDYFHIFSPDIRSLILKRIGKSLKDLIIIVDEAHNLPNRIKDLYTSRLTTTILNRAIEEAKKFKKEELATALFFIKDALVEMSTDETEKHISKKEFIDTINEIKDYETLITELETAADQARESKRISYMGSVAEFLTAWQGGETGFARIFSRQRTSKDEILMLSYRCLDPAIAAKPVIEESSSTIMMSGTLAPTAMYKVLLGFDDADEATYKSPFPEENKLNLIIPETTTKFEHRGKLEYQKIAKVLGKIVNAIPGNSAVFFPSYDLRDNICSGFSSICKKPLIFEESMHSKEEKHELLERFKSHQKTGAVLLGVISGSFGEGIDLPGDYLKGVVVVGLPLATPNLETKSLIKYYDDKFGRGWDYGYVFPAFNKAIQSAGRCIRSETDRGVMIFLDTRYSFPMYRRCFPDNWKMTVTLDYEKLIKGFFLK
jgi:DNA excision repair protein ERCC-2